MIAQVLNDGIEGLARPEDCGNASVKERRNIRLRNGAAQDDQNMIGISVFELSYQARYERIVRA